MVEDPKITSGSLIASGKVKGTNVYDLTGEKLGYIEDIMIDKVSGRTIYAILSFGGFLGMGVSHYPLPWRTLSFDPSRDGYAVSISKELLKDAPYYDPITNFEWTPDYGRRVDSYYKMPTYWT